MDVAGGVCEVAWSCASAGADAPSNATIAVAPSKESRFVPLISRAPSSSDGLVGGIGRWWETVCTTEIKNAKSMATLQTLAVGQMYSKVPKYNSCPWRLDWGGSD